MFNDRQEPTISFQSLITVCHEITYIKDFTVKIVRAWPRMPSPTNPEMPQHLHKKSCERGPTHKENAKGEKVGLMILLPAVPSVCPAGFNQHTRFIATETGQSRPSERAWRANNATIPSTPTNPASTYPFGPPPRLTGTKFCPTQPAARPLPTGAKQAPQEKAPTKESPRRRERVSPERTWAGNTRPPAPSGHPV